MFSCRTFTPLGPLRKRCPPRPGSARTSADSVPLFAPRDVFFQRATLPKSLSPWQLGGPMWFVGKIFFPRRDAAARSQKKIVTDENFPERESLAKKKAMVHPLAGLKYGSDNLVEKRFPDFCHQVQFGTGRYMHAIRTEGNLRRRPDPVEPRGGTQFSYLWGRSPHFIGRRRLATRASRQATLEMSSTPPRAS